MIQPMVSFLESAIQYSNDDYIYGNHDSIGEFRYG